MSEGSNLPATRPEAPKPAPLDTPAVPLTMEQRMSPAQLALTLWTTLPDTPEGKALTIALAQGSDESDRLSKQINTIVPVSHVLVHTVEIVDDDGVVSEGDRIVLIGPDGESTACVSKGVRKSLQFIMGMYGVPPWEPPMMLKVTQHETRRGKRFFSLHPVAEAQQEKAPKGKGK